MFIFWKYKKKYIKMQNITILFLKNSSIFFNSIKSLYLLQISLLPLLDKPKRKKTSDKCTIFLH